MNVSIDQFRASIGLFNNLANFSKSTVTNVSLTNCVIDVILLFCTSEYLFLIVFLLIIISGDIHPNPGPSNDNSKTLSICHWNLNSLWVDSFAKLNHIAAFLTVKKFDIFCVSESFLDSSISDDDPRLAIQGYTLLRKDFPADSRRGGVCLYYNNHLPLVHRPDLTTLDECIICELRSGSRRTFVITLYRSPSQSSEEFSLFKMKR